MLKRSDYVAIILSFVAMLVFYLILARNLSVELGVPEQLSPMQMPEDYDPVDAWEAEEPEIAVVCGSRENSDRARAMAEMLANLKKPYGLFPTVERITAEQARHIGTIIVTADSWDEIGDGDTLLEYTKRGKRVIFTQMMTGTDAEARNRTIGVQHNNGEVEIEGVLLSDKLLIQGMVYHDSLNCTVSDIRLDARCGKLMVEWSREDKDGKDQIPLIWEKRYGEGWIYGVNGGFLTGEYGMGILTGLLSRMEDAFVYPVVNAKVNLLDSFPELDNPYEEQIQTMYSRNTNMFLRDIVWPYLVKLCELHGLVLSTHTGGPPPADMEEETRILTDLIRRRGCEVDQSGQATELELPRTCSGHIRTVESIFKMQSSVSGMGLAVHYLDMEEIMGENSGDPDYEWNAYSLELSKLMYDLYQKTDWMDAMTLSMAEERYKRYVLLKPEIRQEEDHITIETENFDEVCFYVVRTDRQAVAGSNCEVSRIGENAYLVKAVDREAVVLLRESTQ